MEALGEEMRVRDMVETFNYLNTFEPTGDSQEAAINIIVKMKYFDGHEDLKQKLPMQKMNKIVQEGLNELSKSGNDNYESWVSLAKKRGFEVEGGGQQVLEEKSEGVFENTEQKKNTALENQLQGLADKEDRFKRMLNLQNQLLSERMAEYEKFKDAFVS